MAKKPIRTDIGQVLNPTNITTDGMDFEGQLGVDSTDNKLKAKLNNVIQNIVTESGVATLTNKTINADNNTISELEVDNLKSGVLNTSTTLASASNTQVPSALAVKTYVDNSSGSVQTDVDDLITLSGVAANSTDLGTFSGIIIPDGSTVKEAFESLDTQVTSNVSVIMDLSEEIQDLATLSGVPIDSTDLGTFTGTTIPDNTTVKGALQALETSLDAVVVSNAEKVTGPVSATDNAVVRYDLSSGKTVQNSVVTISDTGDVAGVKDLAASGNATITGNMTSSGVIASGDFREGVSTNNQSGTSVVLTGLTSPIVVLTNSSLVSIAGINAVASGRSITLINRTGNSVNIENEAVSVGTANQRILTGTKATLSLADQASILIKDDSINNRFSIIGGSGAGGGSSLATILQLTGSDVSTWVSGNNAAFLGGGSLAGTFVANTSTPLQGVSSYLYTQAAGSLNDYISSAVQPVDVRFRGNSATLTFPYTYTGTSSDINVIVYCATTLQVLSPNAVLQASTTNAIFRTNVTIPAGCTGVRIGYQVATLSNGSVFSFDSVQLSSDTTVYADIVDVKQASTISQTATIGGAVITGALTTSTGSGNYSYNSGTGTYTVLKTGNYFLGVSLLSSGAIICTAEIRVNGVKVSAGTNDALSTTSAYAGWNAIFPAGTTFQFWSSANNSSNQYISVLSTSANQNILTAPETFSTDTAPLVYASSAAYTLATLNTAPVGTFITFTYAANTNTRTQTTTAPTQTTADMNANGMLLYTRVYASASTAAQPTVFAIQIGKGMKGVTNSLYKSAGKSISGSLDCFYEGTASNFGALLKEYNETTGILIVDSGNVGTLVTAHSFIFSDPSSQTNGYLTINASKNPAITGLNISTVGAVYNTTAGGVMAASGTGYYVNFENKEYDPNGLVTQGTNMTTSSVAGWKFTTPSAGFYDISALLTFATTVGQNTGLSVSIVKNGVVFSRSSYTSVTTGSTAGDQTSLASGHVYLVPNDTIQILVTQFAAASKPLTAASAACRISIVKVSVG